MQDEEVDEELPEAAHVVDLLELIELIIVNSLLLCDLGQNCEPAGEQEPEPRLPAEVENEAECFAAGDHARAREEHERDALAEGDRLLRQLLHLLDEDVAASQEHWLTD